MLIVGNCIISDDIADRLFCCDMASCHGRCCVEGDAGAPLESDEAVTLKRIFPQVEPYMTEAGRKAVEEQGVAVYDSEGDLGTPLVSNGECAFVTWDGPRTSGLALCALEKAFRDGKTDFLKPISCHLYPVRVENYGEFTSLNYHKWEVCQSAVCPGNTGRMPLYKFLKEALVRRFGQQWYDELVQQIDESQRYNSTSK